MSTKDSKRGVSYREIPELPGFRFGADGSVWNRCGRGPRTTEREWRRLKPTRRPTGFEWFYSGPREKTKPHRLDEMICRAFHGDRPPGADCVHRDGNRANCRPQNLFWGTLPENIPDTGVEYRTIPQCDGYKFGADGSAWSRWGTGFHNRPGGIWRRLHGYRLESGHLQVTVRWEGKNRRVGLHHILCIAFYGPRPQGMEARHIDGDPASNKITNLRWSRRTDNVQDQLRHGTLAMGERSGKNKLTEKKVREIRRKYAAGNVSIRALAIEFSVAWPTIQKVISRKTWRHVL